MPLLGRQHIIKANLLAFLFVGTNRGTQHASQHLCAKAYSKERHIMFQALFNEGQLLLDPIVFVAIISAVGTAKDDDSGIT